MNVNIAPTSETPKSTTTGRTQAASSRDTSESAVGDSKFSDTLTAAQESKPVHSSENKSLKKGDIEENGQSVGDAQSTEDGQLSVDGDLLPANDAELGSDTERSADKVEQTIGEASQQNLLANGKATKKADKAAVTETDDPLSSEVENTGEDADIAVAMQQGNELLARLKMSNQALKTTPAVDGKSLPLGEDNAPLTSKQAMLAQALAADQEADDGQGASVTAANRNELPPALLALLAGSSPESPLTRLNSLDKAKLDTTGKVESRDSLLGQQLLAATNSSHQPSPLQVRAEAMQAQPFSPATREMVGEQVSEQVQMMMSKNLKQIDIRLDPPELGRMQIRMNLNGDQASVQFTVSHHQVRDVVEQSMQRLREMFSQQGIQLTDASVQQQASEQQQERYTSKDNQLQEQSSVSVSGDEEIFEPEQKLNLQVTTKRDGISLYA